MSARHVGEIVEVTRDCEIGQETELATVTDLDGPYMTLTFHRDTTQGRGLVVHTGANYKYLRTSHTLSKMVSTNVSVFGETHQIEIVVYRSDDGALVIEIDTPDLSDEECAKARIYMNDALAIWTHP